MKFTTYNDNFYLKYSESNRFRRTCGNGPIFKAKATSWSKGVWNLEEEGGYVFLILEHFNAEKGKKYVRTKWVDYQILEITEDRMVLEKLTEQLIN